MPKVRELHVQEDELRTVCTVALFSSHKQTQADLPKVERVVVVAECHSGRAQEKAKGDSPQGECRKSSRVKRVGRARWHAERRACYSGRQSRSFQQWAIKEVG